MTGLWRLNAANAFRVELWNGCYRRCGHRGRTQKDFNLTGHVHSWRPIRDVTCVINDTTLLRLGFKPFRRIAEYGDFNADIPIALLNPGANWVTIMATDITGAVTSTNVIVVRSESGFYPLPVNVRWDSVQLLDDVGECTDGKWSFGPEGIRTVQAGYDRIFLIGDQTWKDYDVTTRVTVHSMAKRPGRQSGRVRHVGFCFRWKGHSNEDNARDAQPKWGLHPRGGVAWLTIVNNRLPPVRQFFPGDSEEFETFGSFPIEFGQPFAIRGSCETLGAHTTRYSFKAWHINSPEPDNWDFQVVQDSATALRSGALALVAHELDVTFGDIKITGTTSEQSAELSASAISDGRSLD